MADAPFETWIEVPHTDGRAVMSNRGHLKVLGKKRRIGNHTVVEFVNEPRRVVCDFQTREFGWWLHLDMRRNFFSRDELVGLFPESLRDIDRSGDSEAIRVREEQWRDLAAERKEGECNAEA